MRRPIHYAWVILGLVVVAVFASLGLGRFGYTTILPAMQEDLRLTNAQTGELQSWNLLGYLMTVVVAGLLASRYGARVVVSVALSLTGAAMILTGLVPTFTGARWGRFLTGVGGAGANVPSMALLSAWFGPRRRGLAAGIGVAGSSVGLMVTGPLVPAILSAWDPQGWRVAWYVLGSMALAACVLVSLGLRNHPAEMGLPVLGEEALNSRPPSGLAGPVPGWRAVYRSGTLWHLAAVYFGFGFSYIIFSTFFIRYLVSEVGFERAQAGWLWLKIGMLSGISGLIWGIVSDRWGRRLALLCVFLLQGTSFLVFGLYPHASGAYLAAALFAMTAWSIPALMAALAGDLFGPKLAPAALGLMTIVFGAGQVLGPLVAGQMADAAHSFKPAFVTAGLMALILGAGGSWWLPRRLREASPGSPVS
jgi:MFS family permease